MSVVLHIERLVLDESLLGSEHAGAVRAAIERELKQRLAQPGMVEALLGLGHVDAMPAVALPAPTQQREGLAPRIARAVQHGLSPSSTGGKHG
ncbi:hypothetical protein [Dyella japonica]|uniref:Uncharacterized protein n=1 Tax=Dyella japonica TaxID=231455 RepID=A0ABV2JYP2_9GAMM